MNDGLRLVSSDIAAFSRLLLQKYSLRSYQVEVAARLAGMVSAKEGGKAAVVFSRQSGKDEMLAQLLAFLLFRYQFVGGSVVVGLPTKQQADISQSRLLARLSEHSLLRKANPKDNKIRFGKASVSFLSADPSANVRGETASLLLVANEAQDIKPDIWDARFDPMGASTNAPTLFMGTPWLSSSLLSRETKEARRQGNLWLVPWSRVAVDVPAYGQRVLQRIEQFGENHPYIRTEYFCEELGDGGGLFPASRRALMAGGHKRCGPGGFSGSVAMLVDVAGSDETSDNQQVNSKRDSTAITFVGVEVNQGLPTYRVLNRLVWNNVPISQQGNRIAALFREWRASWLVIDATGVGAGLASNLTAAVGKKVIPFVFTLKSKSDLGWGLAGLAESGRYLDYTDDGVEDTKLFWRQLAAVEYEVLDGPGRLMRWSVSDQSLHDDLVMSASLVVALEGLDFRPRLAVGSI